MEVDEICKVYSGIIMADMCAEYRAPTTRTRSPANFINSPAFSLRATMGALWELKVRRRRENSLKQYARC